MSSKLIVSAAGSGKTQHIINEAIKSNKSSLIVTYTIDNKEEIIKKFQELEISIPKNVQIMTWFSFLIKHGVKPYQSYILDKEITGMEFVNGKSAIKYRRGKYAVTYRESEPDKFYINNSGKIYSDKISKFVYECNKKCKNKIFTRIRDIFKNVYIDEVQDMNGYDLDIIRNMMLSNINVLMVGDPRQVTYHTHYSKKNNKYSCGEIKEYVKDKCNAIDCEIDETSLKNSYRCSQKICEYSSKLFPDFSKSDSIRNDSCSHCGVFVVKPSDVDYYLEKINPVQIRHDKRVLVNEDYPVINMGASKGKTFNDVLIYPTNDINKWIKDNDHNLNSSIRSKFYVALTRAKYSAAIVYDYSENEILDGIIKFI